VQNDTWLDGACAGINYGTLLVGESVVGMIDEHWLKALAESASATVKFSRLGCTFAQADSALCLTQQIIQLESLLKDNHLVVAIHSP
jgi:hypothetical protein